MKCLKLGAAVVTAAALLGVGTATVAAAAPAHAGPMTRPAAVTCGSTVVFQNGGAGRVWDIQGANSANGTPIQMYHPNGGWNQHFQACTSDGGLSYFILNPANPGSGKCVEADATLQLEPCTGGADQAFQFLDATVSGEEVESINSGECVTIPNSNFNDGIVLTQSTCNAGRNQLFWMNAA